MSERKYLNNDWKFSDDFTKDATISVRIPHTSQELPYHYFNENEYQMLCKYERPLFILDEWKDKKLLLTFDGAAHEAKVYINEQKVAEHRCGYTAFTIDISDAVEYGKSNKITVLLDTRESLNIPPFGGPMDFLTYGGIYRDVYLDIKEASYIKDLFFRSAFPDGHVQAISRIHVENIQPSMQIRQGIRAFGSDKEYTDVGFVAAAKGTIGFTLGSVHRWSVDDPALYEIRTELIHEGRVIDSRIDKVGFREIEFRKDAFYLNGEKLKIRGLNRYQSYPYVGYAMPDSMQRKDADILKYELGVNAVRTACYPQSQAFIDRCDELGILVLTEIPGWRTIGNTAWKNQAMENARDMILQYRNHPSIILWGVRVSESEDDTDFYSRMNNMAHALDSTRPTTGVRENKKGEFQEDVFAYNDFSFNGMNAPCEKKSEVTPDLNKAYLISGFNGPMYPTKAFDSEAHRAEHALRYAQVLDAVESDGEIAGSFGWCFTDYHTHGNFDCGDRICYHGVMDSFRNPKLAASAYRMYQKEEPFLHISSTMNPGENPGNAIGDVYAYTNADSVRMYRNDTFIREYKRSGMMPISIDDFIGNVLVEEEDYTESQAATIKSRLNAMARFGENMVKQEATRFSLLNSRAQVSNEDIRRLYDKYLGNTREKVEYRFDAIQDGKVVSTVIKRPMTMHDLEIKVSHHELHDDKTYDVASIRFRAIDENGNPLPYANDPIAIKAEGSIDLIGPKLITLQGGMGGAYVRTNGKKGVGTLLLTGLRGTQVPAEQHHGDGHPISGSSGGHGYEIAFTVK